MVGTELSAHQISDIQTCRVQSRYPRLVGKNARLGVHGGGPTTLIRVLTTNHGATGWGLSWDESLNVERWIGARVSDLFDPQTGLLNAEARALDLALHDLAGVILNQPVYEIIGALGQTAVPCYDGAIYMDDLDPESNPLGIEAVLINCTQDYELGYRAFKLKIGRGYRWMEAQAGLERDIQVTREVRKHFPDCGILVDANDGYTCPDFLTYLAAVVDCNLYWIEEPFYENREDLLKLRAFLDRHSPQTLIADGESRYDLNLLLPLAEERLVDVLIMDIAGFGLTAWRQWMPRLAAAGIYAAPHTWGDPLKTLYTCQLAAGTGNVPVVEGVPGVGVGMNWDSYSLYEGKMYVPQLPGFGIRLSPGF